MSYLSYVMTMPGLETLAFGEVRARIADAELVKFSRGIALFRTDIAPAELLELRTAEDVFVALAHIKGLGPGRNALRAVHGATLNADVTQALTLWRRAHHGSLPRSWRVVSQKWGSHEFRRIDAGDSVGAALQRMLPRGMRQVKDDADIEFWIWISGSEAFIGVRLSDASMRHRNYKHEHLPASLRPTVAAAMSLLSRPTSDDVVLDPLCGAGTILIERALAEPYETLLGGDLRPEAVGMARRNARAANVDARIETWDARDLSLEPASVTRIITNLPFGKQIGTHEQNVKLYMDLVQEFQRILTPDGLLVALTSEDRLWETALRKHGWRVSKKVVLVVLGQPASIFVAARA
ncbi:THUMP domain-containing class I SAM-dependent methyltransferase [Ktedonospora formicarum]|uniref:RNA methyltransferase n=1 Tax=Ktedonospora formicarum TaxID=2778364 RepID=A0A8J3MNQ7_9CHLR|nr:methyltransferase [Ktedonospora formicarum]GHO43032.1 RNA methyltransferase [Ktedonospora formicarum]